MKKFGKYWRSLYTSAQSLPCQFSHMVQHCPNGNGCWKSGKRHAINKWAHFNESATGDGTGSSGHLYFLFFVCFGCKCIDYCVGLGSMRAKKQQPSNLTGFVSFFHVPGLPKAARVSHMKAVMSMGFLRLCGATASDNIYVTLPLYHMAASLLGIGGCIDLGREWWQQQTLFFLFFFLNFLRFWVKTCSAITAATADAPTIFVFETTVSSAFREEPFETTYMQKQYQLALKVIYVLKDTI